MQAKSNKLYIYFIYAYLLVLLGGYTHQICISVEFPKIVPRPNFKQNHHHHVKEHPQIPHIASLAHLYWACIAPFTLSQSKCNARKIKHPPDMHPSSASPVLPQSTPSKQILRNHRREHPPRQYSMGGDAPAPPEGVERTPPPTRIVQNASSPVIARTWERLRP